MSKLNKVYILKRTNELGESIASVHSNKNYLKDVIIDALKRKYIDEGYILDDEFFGELRVYKEIVIGQDEDFEEFTIEEWSVLPKGYYNAKLEIEKYL